MSRSGYADDIDDTWALIRWRGAVNSAIRGARGQAFLVELRDALDAMPVKELITDELVHDGCMCTLGVVGAARGIDMTHIDPYASKKVAATFGIAPAMAREVMFENDQEWGYGETPAQRWVRMRKWVDAQIVKEQAHE